MYKILVVEDEKAISDLVTMSLELEEYQVEVAFDGEEGAKKIEGAALIWRCLILCCPSTMVMSC